MAVLPAERLFKSSDNFLAKSGDKKANGKSVGLTSGGINLAGGCLQWWSDLSSHW